MRFAFMHSLFLITAEYAYELNTANYLCITAIAAERRGTPVLLSASVFNNSGNPP